MGTGKAERGGKDYRGRVASEAEAMFILGDRATWKTDELRWQKILEDSAAVLRLADEEKLAVQSGTTAYCVHALRKCATRVVQAPSAVFRGLRREGPLSEGLAYCGNGRRAYGNDGQPLDVNLDSFVFVVYANPQGYVFDWDWVEADENDLSIPRAAFERFNSRIAQSAAVLVDVENLQPGKFVPGPWYSRRGDCIFYYISDAIICEPRQ